MSAPMFIESVGDVAEPGHENVYRDRVGEYWWYGTDQEGDRGWVWGAEGEVGHQAVRCGYARSWTTDTGKDLPWTHVGTIVDGEFQPPEIPINPAGFVVKDSGVREEYANGFVRDTEDGKYDYARILRIEGLHLIPIEALERWGAHMVKGAEKYGEDNWKQARGPIAIGRFLRSLCRHVVKYIRKDRTEDHAAAVCFNVWAAELTPEEE